MTLSQLLDPKVFAKLTADDVDRLEAVINGEIAANTQIQKILKARLEHFVPHLGAARKGPKGGGG